MQWGGQLWAQVSGAPAGLQPPHELQQQWQPGFGGGWLAQGQAEQPLDQRWGAHLPPAASAPPPRLLPQPPAAPANTGYLHNGPPAALTNGSVHNAPHRQVQGGRGGQKAYAGSSAAAAAAAAALSACRRLNGRIKRAVTVQASGPEVWSKDGQEDRQVDVQSCLCLFTSYKPLPLHFAPQTTGAV